MAKPNNKKKFKIFPSHHHGRVPESFEIHRGVTTIWYPTFLVKSTL